MKNNNSINNNTIINNKASTIFTDNTGYISKNYLKQSTIMPISTTHNTYIMANDTTTFTSNSIKQS